MAEDVKLTECQVVNRRFPDPRFLEVCKFVICRLQESEDRIHVWDINYTHSNRIDDRFGFSAFLCGADYW